MTTRPWLDRKCPKCGAESGKSCRAMTTGRVTDTHAARWQTTTPDPNDEPGARAEGERL